MADRMPPCPAIGAVVYPAEQSPEALLAAFAAELAARGFRVGGVTQDTRLGADGCKCTMEVVELDSGRRINLSQDLGRESNSCALDPAALAEASGALRRAVEGGADVVFANKYAKVEMGGGGLAAEMLQAMVAGVPLLTALPAAYLGEWLAFTGGRGHLLAPTRAALWRWWGPERLYDDLILGVEECAVRRVVHGAGWVMVEGPHGAGLAQRPEGEAPEVAGLSLRALAALARSWDGVAAAVGMAAINAHYNRFDLDGDTGNGLEALECDPAGAVVIGAFPGIADRLPGARVIERQPQPGQFPAEAAQWLLPGAEGVLITASALVNHTLPGLLRAAAEVPVVLVGPGTPLTARLFDYGPAVLAGLVCTDADAMAAAVAAGACAKELKAFGRQVTLRAPEPCT